MKVTFCTYDDPKFIGGPNSWLRRLLPALKFAGLEVSVLFFINSTDRAEHCPCYRNLHTQGINCQTFPWTTTTEQKIRWLLSKLSEAPPDIFVPNMLVPAFYASRWVKEAGILTIGVLHSDDEFYWGVVKEFVLSQTPYQLSALVCVSKFLEEYVSQSGKTKTLVKKISPGVPLPQQQATPPSECLKLIYVGRLEEEQKRISEVTYALCRVVREISNTEAVIFGSGSAKSNVEKILSEQAVELPVRLGGLVNNAQIQEVMLDHHVLVLLSDYEGLGLSVMEAMACGLVPICLRVRCGIPELVEDGITGLLINDRGDDFVAAVRRLKTNPELWHRLSLAARAKIQTGYSNEVCTKQWLDLFSELQEQSKVKKEIRNPFWLRLPPVKPYFAKEDRRKTQILFKKIVRKIKRLVNIN